MPPTLQEPFEASEEGRRELEILLRDWLYRTQDEVVAEIDSTSLEEISALLVAWTIHRLVAHQKDFAASNERRQQVYSAIVGKFHSRESYILQAESVRAELRHRATPRATRNKVP
jgi:hypothetical protein